ncbi:MAG: efflux RND transporter periplasmic adaptor subunit [Anaerolineaceae bacterium]|jgi:multidrug resistance efflux pump|nr:efflux RND transporter periplasmic adaptor subunit [Anaerolineaceae bacterium]
MQYQLKNVVVMILMAAALLAGCEGGNPEGDAVPETEFLVNVSPVVSVTGVVVPEQWATLSIANNGVVEELFVDEGDSVKAGEVLLRLDGQERLQAARDGAELELLAARRALDDLTEKWPLIKAQAELELAQAEIALEDVLEDRQDLDYQRAGQNTVDELRANVILAKDAVDTAEENFGWVEDSSEDDPNRAYALTQLAQARRAYDRAVANLNYALGLPDAGDISEADALVAIAKARVADAELELTRLQDGPNPLDVEQAQMRLANAKSQLAAAEKSLAELSLRAPFDGTVSRLNVRLNEWVVPGQPLILFGNLSSLQVETTDLSEIDVAQIQPGSIADVTFDALPSAMVEGRVVRISPKANEGAGVNYTVILVLNEIPEGLRWGMTAFVDIDIEN